VVEIAAVDACGVRTAVLVVAAAFFSTNWIAHHSLNPPYLHRSGTDNWYDYEFERNGKVVESYWRTPAGIDRGGLPAASTPCTSWWATTASFSLTPGVAAVDRRHDRLDVAGPRPTAPLGWPRP